MLVFMCDYLCHLFIVSSTFSTLLWVAVLTVFEEITSQAAKDRIQKTHNLSLTVCVCVCVCVANFTNKHVVLVIIS